MFIAINRQLRKPLDEEDPGFPYMVWSKEDESFSVTSVGEGVGRQGVLVKKDFYNYIEEWEVKERKNNVLFQEKVEKKYLGIVLYDDGQEDIDSGDDAGSDEEVESKGFYIIKQILWEKHSKGSGKTWRARCDKVVKNASGGWDPVYKADSCGEEGEEVWGHYGVDDSLHECVKAAEDESPSLNMIAAP